MSAPYTLVIPTFNRAGQLRSQLDYLQQVGFAHPVMVLDSSADPAVLAANAHTVEAFRGTIARHVFPAETFFYDKVREGLQVIDTAFFSFCADDDFVIPGGVDALIQALTAEPALTFAQGVFGRMVDQSGGPEFYLEYKAKNYRHTTAFARLQEFLVDIESTFYSVFRRAVFLRGLEAAKPIRSMLFNELFASLAPLVQGCGVGVPVLYYLRGSGPAAQKYSRWHPVMWICDDRHDFLTQFSAYRDLLVDFMRSCPGAAPTADAAELTEMLNKVHFLYVCEGVISLKPYYLSHITDSRRTAGIPIKGQYAQFPVAEPFWVRWLRDFTRKDTSLDLPTPQGRQLSYHEKLVARVGRPGIVAAHPAIATYTDRRLVTRSSLP